MFLSRKLFQEKEPHGWYAFLICHFLVWTLVPLLRVNMPMDSLEAIVWGSELTWGSDKHPTLAAWIAYVFYQIIPNPDLAMYVLSQVCVLIGFIFIYKLAKEFLVDKMKALFATLLLEGTIYYSICSIEFNVNVLSLAIVPALTYAFYRAVFGGRLGAWMWVGVLAGAAFLTKYTNGVFFVGFATYLCTTIRGRVHLKRFGVYFAAGVALIIVAPHIDWLIRHDFYPFDYLTMRAGGDKPWYGHILYPITFLLSQIAACGLSVLAFFILWFFAREKGAIRLKIPRFWICVGIVPLSVLVGVSLLFNVPMKSMWGFPFLFLVPTFLFWRFPFKVRYADEKRGVFLTYGLMFFLAIALVVTSLCHISKRANFSGRDFTTQMNAVWVRRYGIPLLFVGGDVWFASNIAVYLPKHQHVLIEMNRKTAPWIDEQKALRHGILVVALNRDMYQSYQQRYPQLTEPESYAYTLRNAFGKEKQRTVYVGFVAPEGIK